MYVPDVDPARDAIVAKLTEQGEACIHADPAREGCIQTWLKAIRCAATTDLDYSWSIVLSDDADPLRGWQQHLERACTYSPEQVLGLTHFGSYGQQALAKGAPYGVGPNLTWGGGIAYHRSIVRDLAEWCTRTFGETGYVHDDRMVAAFQMRRGRQTALAARAIFGQPIKKSLLNHNTQIRHPYTTIENCEGPEWSATPRFVKVRSSVAPEIKQLAGRQ
jgi:hypothetical protein